MLLAAAARSFPISGRSFIHLAMCRLARNYYEVLGLKKTAKQNEIKRAYYELAKKYHPDVNSKPDAAKKFQELAKAYEVLVDPRRRSEYDQLETAVPPPRQRNYNVDPRRPEERTTEEQTGRTTEEMWEEIWRYASSSPYSWRINFNIGEQRRRRTQRTGRSKRWTGLVVSLVQIVVLGLLLYDEFLQSLRERRSRRGSGGRPN